LRRFLLQLKIDCFDADRSDLFIFLYGDFPFRQPYGPIGDPLRKMELVRRVYDRNSLK